MSKQKLIQDLTNAANTATATAKYFSAKTPTMETIRVMGRMEGAATAYELIVGQLESDENMDFDLRDRVLAFMMSVGNMPASVMLKHGVDPMEWHNLTNDLNKQ